MAEEEEGEGEGGGEEEEDDAASAWAVEENGRDGGSLYPMYFGASCAFLALHLLSAARGPDMGGTGRRRLGEMLLQGSASLLGLLLWRAQKAGEEMAAALRGAEEEVSLLKSLRAEDAKANEKVVGIFAAREQGWIAEKRKLKLQIQALMAQFRVLDVQKQEAAANFAGKILEKEAALEEETKKTAELEERLRAAEKEARDNADEMGHALRRVEVAVGELAEARRQKDAAESAAEALITKMAEVKRDSEQKEKILSAMLRKSKADTAERLALMKEVREKQVEMEVERLRRRMASRGFSSMNVELSRGRTGFHRRTLLVDYLEADSLRESGFIDTTAAAGDDLDRCSGEDSDEELDARNLQEWARSEAEKYAAVLRRRHRAELEAFADQMRLKDEKVEAYRRRLIGMELESKRLQSHVEGLDGSLSHFREECVKLEALLLDRERELRALKNKLFFPMKNHRRRDPDCDSARSPLRRRRREGPPAPAPEMVPLESRGETMAEHGPPETSAGSKMDLHALGVSYKIKRLKQQLLALERLAAAQALSQPPNGCDDDGGGKEEYPPRGLLPAMTVLSKQVKRYQTLEEKADDLSKRMSGVDGGSRRRGRGKEQREALEGFLEEAFHLQRHVVATGQKLLGIQSWLTTGLIGGGGPKSAAAEFNLARFAAVVRILFREVQVGLEGQIARIIGNLEEALACDGILHEKR